MNSKSPTRVVTNNLYVSATIFERKEHHVTWTDLINLSRLIELFVLCDGVYVLSRLKQDERFLKDSDVFNLLRQENFLDEVNNLAEGVARDVSERAFCHLLAFLNERDLPQSAINNLFEEALNPEFAFNALQDTPDDGRDFLMGQKWLEASVSKKDAIAQLRDESEHGRSYAFMIRTFLYLGYSDWSRQILVPDAAREKAYTMIARREARIIEPLLRAWKEATGKSVKLGSGNIYCRIPPLAAYVFHNSKSVRQIPKTMEKLRRDFSEQRSRIQQAERHLRDADLEATYAQQQKWIQAINELCVAFSGEPSIVKLKSLAPIGVEATKILAKAAVGVAPTPQDFVGVTSKLPSNWVAKWWHRRPLAELHKLRKKLPGPPQLYQDVERLFGNVRP